ncbi:MAG: hypothetical protein ACKV19_12010 [Verrucomicrobiales bacterium]
MEPVPPCRLYQWDEWIDHAWLAVDPLQRVAFVQCAEVQGIPTHLSIPEYLTRGLRSEVLEAQMKGDVTPNTNRRIKEASKDVACRDAWEAYADYVHGLGRRGFYVYDFALDKKQGYFYCFVEPQCPVSVQEMPASLRMLARIVRVEKPWGERSIYSKNDFCSHSIGDTGATGSQPH